MEEGATILATCRKVFSFHKLTNALSKSRESTILQTEDKEFPNWVSERANFPATRKTKIMELLTLRRGSLLSWLKLKAVMLDLRNLKPSPIPGRISSTIQLQAQKASSLAACIVRKSHTTINYPQINSTPTKTSNNFSKESNKWNSPCSMETTHQK